MGWLARLDRYATDEPQFHKPRRGDCRLCGRPVIEHPAMAHRWRALLAHLFLVMPERTHP